MPSELVMAMPFTRCAVLASAKRKEPNIDKKHVFSHAMILLGFSEFIESVVKDILRVWRRLDERAAQTEDETVARLLHEFISSAKPNSHVTKNVENCLFHVLSLPTAFNIKTALLALVPRQLKDTFRAGLGDWTHSYSKRLDELITIREDMAHGHYTETDVTEANAYLCDFSRIAKSFKTIMKDRTHRALGQLMRSREERPGSPSSSDWTLDSKNTLVSSILPKVAGNAGPPMSKQQITKSFPSMSSLISNNSVSMATGSLSDFGMKKPVSNVPPEVNEFWYKAKPNNAATVVHAPPQQPAVVPKAITKKLITGRTLAPVSENSMSPDSEFGDRVKKTKEKSLIPIPEGAALLPKLLAHLIPSPDADKPGQIKKLKPMKYKLKVGEGYPDDGETLAIIQKRCKAWPECWKGDRCKFIHPTKKCLDFPFCNNGVECLFIHPVCPHRECENQFCPYMHVKPRRFNYEIKV